MFSSLSTPFGAGGGGPTPGLFGKPAGTPATGLGAPVPSSAGQPVVSLSTKYGDLPEAVRSQVDEVEKFIQSQIHLAESLDHGPVAKGIQTVRDGVQGLQDNLESVKMLIETDSLVLDDLKTQMNRELKWMDLAARFLDKAKVPGQGGKYSVQAGDTFFNYFVQLVNSLERRSQDYKVHMEELETNVRSASLMHVKASPQVIQETLHKQHSSFLALANHVASTHEQVEKAVSEFKDYAKRFQMDEALKYVSVLSPESGKGTKGELTLSEMGEGLVPETVVSSAPAGSVGFGATPFGNGSTSLFGRK